MTRLRGSMGLALLAALLVIPGAGRAAGAEPSAPPMISYAQLGEVVKKSRGKVVVVDFWNVY